MSADPEITDAVEAAYIRGRSGYIGKSGQEQCRAGLRAAVAHYLAEQAAERTEGHAVGLEPVVQGVVQVGAGPDGYGCCGARWSHAWNCPDRLATPASAEEPKATSKEAPDLDSTVEPPVPEENAG